MYYILIIRDLCFNPHFICTVWSDANVMAHDIVVCKVRREVLGETFVHPFNNLFNVSICYDIDLAEKSLHLDRFQYRQSYYFNSYQQWAQGKRSVTHETSGSLIPPRIAVPSSRGMT